ncbi:peptidoglycan/LPS O-acetylase OafA/YrhL [Actinoplanes lutulentus]|uniref:Peptidoglycan/LPS O-acetylase OafA/YrhL n=1 Tax=Actinoplanes lutulentus TaxID=1287878 RepID=A0A327ZHT9_9ACTN|nr:peptidoglycan/LPS O-acetylase OafA/YrhL [Actinoplanes lutulentus]RAK40284.1 peptidoglycan/LPS O-acetylase OafA/YrhL [Actinoplanes lutulentus]
MPEGIPTVRRLGWLDALRAVAVLLVLYAHLTRYVFTGARAVTSEWLHAGTAGVMLFFLVSGYIIPASLERHGDLRTFWAGRVCRLWPLYIAVVAIAAFLPASPEISARSLAAHASMLPFLLDVPLVTAVLWTLTFEMAFYLLVSALFALRLRRVEAPVAVLLVVLAVITAPLTNPAGTKLVPALIALAAGLAGVCSRRRWAVIAGGLTLVALVSILLLSNMDPSHAWDGLLILAVMFTGTAIYRADTGQIPWWPVLITTSIVAAALLANWFAELRSLGALTPHYMARSVITLLVFGGAFAAGMATRRWRTPAWLARIGVLSYSLYLVHYVLLQVVGPRLHGLPGALAFLAVLFGICTLTYRYIELPGQRIGRAQHLAIPLQVKRALEPSRVSGAEDTDARLVTRSTGRPER